MAIIKNNVENVKFLRNQNPFGTRELARQALEDNKGQAADGTALLARYTVSGEVKTIVGFVYVTGSTHNITIFDTEGASGDVEELRREINAKLGEGITSLNTATAQLAALSGNAQSTSAETSVAGAKKYADGLIESLDYTDAAVEGQYVSQVTQADGKIAVTRVALPSVNAISEAGKPITAVSESLGAISATAGTINAEYVNITNAGSIITATTVEGAIAEIATEIDAMDKTADVVAGQVVTTVSENDGIVSEIKANVKDLQLGGYSKDSSATGDIASTDTVNAALSKLENKAAAITITNADGSINVTTGANGTDINVNIKSGEHVLAKDGDAGLYTNIALSSITPTSTTVREEYQLTATDGSKLGDTIKIYKDSSISKIYLGYSTDTVDEDSGVITSGTTGEAQSLNYVYHKEDGKYEMVHVDVSKFLVESEFASGVTADTTGVVHGVVDPQSEKDSNNDSFLTVGANGFKVDGIKDEIDAKIGALDATVGDTTVAGGKHVAVQVVEEAGVITAVTVTEDNIADADDLAQEITDRENADTELSNRLGANVTTANAASAQLSALSGTSADASGITSVWGAKKYAQQYTDEKVTTVVASLDADESGSTTHITVNVVEENGVITDVNVEEDNIADADDLAELSGKTITAITSTNGSITASISNEAGNKTADIQTDADKIKMSGFSADNTSALSGIAESDSIATAFEKTNTVITENERITARALTDLDGRLDVVEGEYISGVSVNGKAVTVADKVAPISITAATSAATATSTEAIVVNTDNSGNITLGIANIDCGYYDGTQG